MASTECRFFVPLYASAALMRKSHDSILVRAFIYVGFKHRGLISANVNDLQNAYPLSYLRAKYFEVIPRQEDLCTPWYRYMDAAGSGS